MSITITTENILIRAYFELFRTFSREKIKAFETEGVDP